MCVCVWVRVVLYIPVWKRRVEEGFPFVCVCVCVLSGGGFTNDPREGDG